MIKVNLLNDVGGGVAAISGPSEGGSDGADNKDAAVKVGILLLPVLLIYSYYTWEEWSRDDTIKSLQAQVSSLRGQVTSLQPQINAIQQFQEEKKKLEIQVETIKQLSKERLLNVKVLDALQSIVPSEIWLESLKVDDRAVNMTGSTTKEILVSDFMQSMNSSIYFENTMLLNTKEKKTNEGIYKEFELSSEIAMGR